MKPIDKRWEELNLDFTGLDYSSGIVYSLRYSKDNLLSHRNNLISYLENNGVHFEDSTEDGYFINFPETFSMTRSQNLIEEIYHLNVSINLKNYYNSDLKSFSDLRDFFVKKYFDYLELEDDSKLFYLKNITIPKFVDDILEDDLENPFLKKFERNSLENLLSFSTSTKSKLAEKMGFAFI